MWSKFEQGRMRLWLDTQIFSRHAFEKRERKILESAKPIWDSAQSKKHGRAGMGFLDAKNTR